MNVKSYKRLPKYMVRQMMPDLVWTHFEVVDDQEKYFCFFDDNNKFVGAMFVRFECFEFQGDALTFTVYIDKFEVAYKRRGEGWGKKMFNWLIDTYPISAVTLCHVLEEKDGGSSYRWWKHMGFHKPNRLYSQMYKRIPVKHRS